MTPVGKQKIQALLEVTRNGKTTEILVETDFHTRALNNTQVIEEKNWLNDFARQIQAAIQNSPELKAFADKSL